MYKLTVIVAAIMAIVAGIIMAPISAIAQSESSSSMSGAFADITTTQDGNTITITITRAEGAPEGGEEIPEVPESPIIIIPDPSGEGNGTVIVPEIPVNVTGGTEGGGFETPVAEEPPVIVIEPEGNATTVTPPSNVTVINNDTVVVAPPDQVVTETPGNVTIIDPPVVTEPPVAEPCQCPVGVEGGAPDIQAPGGNITIQNDTTIIRPDTEPGTESGNGNGENGG